MKREPVVVRKYLYGDLPIFRLRNFNYHYLKTETEIKPIPKEKVYAKKQGLVELFPIKQNKTIEWNDKLVGDYMGKETESFNATFKAKEDAFIDNIVKLFPTQWIIVYLDERDISHGNSEGLHLDRETKIGAYGYDERDLNVENVNEKRTYPNKLSY